MSNPSCPRCSSTDRVEPLDPRLSHQGWPWFCAPCELVFSGTDDEWVRMGYQRRELAENRRTQPQVHRSDPSSAINQPAQGGQS